MKQYQKYTSNGKKMKDYKSIFNKYHFYTEKLSELQSQRKAFYAERKALLKNLYSGTNYQIPEGVNELEEKFKANSQEIKALKDEFNSSLRKTILAAVATLGATAIAISAGAKYHQDYNSFMNNWTGYHETGNSSNPNEVTDAALRMLKEKIAQNLGNNIDPNKLTVSDKSTEVSASQYNLGNGFITDIVVSYNADGELPQNVAQYYSFSSLANRNNNLF